MHPIPEMHGVGELDTAEIHQYRAALRAKLSELETGVRRLDDIAVETAPDAMDDSAFANDRDFAVERLMQITSLLASVRSALDRMEHGGYGVCLNCDEAINPKRLAVLPWAAHCRPCQENLDRLSDTSFERQRVSVLVRQ